MRLELIAALILSANLVGISSPIAGTTRPSEQGEYCEVAASMVDQIHNGSDKGERGDIAADLNSFIYYFPECGQNQDMVRNIADLLDDKNDRVRFYAAAALGNIGPAARSAVPALERALRESDAKLDAFVKKRGPGAVLLPASYSGQAVRAALQKITGKHIPGYGETH